MLRDDVLAPHVGRVTRPFLDDPLGELLLERLVVARTDVGIERHDVPGVGRVLARRRLSGVEHAERARAELHDLRHAIGHLSAAERLDRFPPGARGRNARCYRLVLVFA
jgi:hypothetical protein